MQNDPYVPWRPRQNPSLLLLSPSLPPLYDQDSFEQKTLIAKVCEGTALGRWERGILTMTAGNEHTYSVDIGFRGDGGMAVLETAEAGVLKSGRRVSSVLSGTLSSAVSNVRDFGSKRTLTFLGGPKESMASPAAMVHPLGSVPVAAVAKADPTPPPQKRAKIIQGLNKHQLRGIHGIRDNMKKGEKVGAKFMFPEHLVDFQANKKLCKAHAHLEYVEWLKSPPEGRVVECLVNPAIVTGSRNTDENPYPDVKRIFNVYKETLYERAESRAKLSFVVLYFLLQSKIGSLVFEMFNCRTFANGKSFMLSDFDEECYEDSHANMLFFVTVPTLVLLVLGVPTVLFLVLYNNKNNLHSMDFKLQFGFLYTG
jgi:hypothetical protein